jgi:SulP family sulfate permease
LNTALITFYKKYGYNQNIFYQDLIAGLTVGIVALPLSIAIAIASGASPDKGIITAVIGGFFISFFGGSKFQIGGPTGAFIVVVYSVISKHGYDGLLLATFLASFILFFCGLFKI